jgi:putative PIN family toxin of toxin-antitoxin system
MREELASVLARGVGARYGAQAAEVLALWDRHVRVVNLPPTTPSDHRLRCRDADDQKFLDLGLALNAQWLLTSDQDLLKLRRRAAALGLQVGSPHGWLPGGRE